MGTLDGCIDGTEVWRLGSGRRPIVGLGDAFTVKVGAISSLGDGDGWFATPLSDGENVSV